MDMNFIDTINADNWKEKFDEHMVIKIEKDGTHEYVWPPGVMKRFIIRVLESQKQDKDNEYTHGYNDMDRDY